ncbi:MAG: DUF2269 family protein [Actinobacteria bacterium]|nr:DUF2269 family protein [Actinomycetota bacterium]
MYEYALFVHVLLAVIWVGGGLTMLLLGGRLRKSDDAGKVAEFGSHAEWIGTHVYLPSSILLFLAGVYMVIDGDWGWGTPWVVMGIVGWLFSALVGSLYLGPQGKKLKADMDAGTITDEGLLARVDRIVNVQRIEWLVFLIVVWAMTVKPGV